MKKEYQHKSQPNKHLTEVHKNENAKNNYSAKFEAASPR